MNRLRKIIFWCHLPAGVIGGVIIFIMSVTGALLAFEQQIVRFADRELRTVQQPQGEAQRLGPQAMFAKVREVKPDAKPTGLTLQADPSASASIALGREGVLYVNPYTGEILGEGSKRVRAFFHVTTDLHRWLAMEGENRPVGKAVTGACNIAFLFLAASGIYLWWPKKWNRQNLEAVTVFKPRLKGRARDFNWHNATGIWFALILIIITSTGMVMSYQWANNLLYTLTGNKPPQPPPGAPGGDRARASQAGQGAASKPAEAPAEIPANLDQLWLLAEQQSPNWRSISIRTLPRSGAPLTLSIEEGGTWNPFARSQLTLNTETAEVVKWEPYASLNLGRRLRSWARSMHTGEAAGLPGQIVGFFASLGGGLLVWTGLALAWRRFRAWAVRRSVPVESREPSTADIA